MARAGGQTASERDSRLLSLATSGRGGAIARGSRRRLDLGGRADEAVELWGWLERPRLELWVILRADVEGVALQLEDLHTLTSRVAADELEPLLLHRCDVLDVHLGSE